MLHEVTARLRPRTGWESQDLGLAIARSMVGKILVQWCVILFPIWAILFWLLWDSPGWLLFVAWWLKPVYDRIPLFTMGRSLFGQQTSLKDAVKAAPALIFKGNLYFLTFGRFSFYRCFSMPVKILESSTYSNYRKRVSVLLRQGDSTVFWVTLAWMLTSFLGVIGMFLLLRSMVVQDELMNGEEFMSRFFGTHGFTAENSLWRLISLLFLVVTTLTELFYVGSGFGLYLNSRSHLEGWDIEVAFRSLALRLGRIAAAPTLLVAMLFWQVGAQQLQAKAPATPTVEKVQPISRTPSPLDVVKDVKSSPDFTVHSETHQVYQNSSSTGSSSSSSSSSNLDYSFIGLIGPFILWGSIAALVLLIAYLIYRNRHLFIFHRESRNIPEPPQAKVVMGMNVTAEALPKDIPTTAWEHWLAGDAHGAIRLLYAGSLSWMIQRGGLPIRESDTEGDCVRHSSSLTDGTQTHYFSFLTDTWKRIAYGKRSPAATEMEQLVKQWPFLK